jgi:diguanylate cyclase (GGDEF)-like protein/PAS domain S-box-containing protein
VSDELILLIQNSRAAPAGVAEALARLRNRHYMVAEAQTLADGLTEIRDRRFAAIILELNLPDASGLPAFLRLQSKAATVPIIVMVDRAQEELGMEAARRGALDYLLKEEISAPILDKVLRLALERTHTVLALRASEARYRTMFESTAAGVYQATCDDRLISANPAIVTMLGYESEEELLRLDFGLDIYASAEDHIQWRRELDAAGEIRSRETVLRNKKGERVVVLHSGRLVRDSRNVPLYYEGTIADITASHRQASQWSHEASHDSLTGLLNRRELERRLQAALEDAAIDRSTLAVVMLDLDGFKKVNDRFGHVAGDELLRQVSGTLKGGLRTGDVVGRFGGDEFLVLLEHCAEEDAIRVTAALVERLRALECLWLGQALQARASVGIAVATQRDQSWAQLVERADVACYDAKAHGGNQWRMFRDDATVNVKVGRERRLTLYLEDALTTNAFVLQAERIVPLRNKRAPSHYEVLLRAPADGAEQPAEYLDLAQIAAFNASLAHRVDRWCIKNAFRWIARHQGEHPGIGRWFLNLTQASFSDPELAQYIAAAAREAHAPAQHIGLEIEEQALATGFVQVNDLVRKLAPLGFQFTLDGFGRGISSFAYLKSLDVTNVKIDHAALARGAGDDVSDTLLRSLHQINKVLGRTTIIQSVSSTELLERLALANVDYAQGSAVAGPILLEETRLRA